APGGTPNQSRVSFGNEPIACETVDVNAQASQAAWADGDLTVNARAAVSVSAANFTDGPLAPESIVAVFADGLATTTESASSLPLPLEMGGTRVVARDSAGVERPAALFFISASQINYLMPTETAPGPATVKITSGDGSVFIQMVEVESIA